MTEPELERRAVELSADLADLHARTMTASRERRDVLLELRGRGWSGARIADLLGISQQAVAAILRPRN